MQSDDDGDGRDDEDEDRRCGIMVWLPQELIGRVRAESSITAGSSGRHNSMSSRGTPRDLAVERCATARSFGVPQDDTSASSAVIFARRLRDGGEDPASDAP